MRAKFCGLWLLAQYARKAHNLKKYIYFSCTCAHDVGIMKNSKANHRCVRSRGEWGKKCEINFSIFYTNAVKCQQVKVETVVTCERRKKISSR